MSKNPNIIESKIFDCGMEVTRIDVGSFIAGYVHTKIGKYKGDNKYYLSLDTTPKDIHDKNKAFETIKEAKEYYLEVLSIHYEIIYAILNTNEKKK